MDAILVNLTVLAAALFLARWLYRNIFSRNKKNPCEACGVCPPDEDPKPAKARSASSST